MFAIHRVNEEQVVKESIKSFAEAATPDLGVSKNQGDSHDTNRRRPTPC
jgi:hypothetical protein